MDGRRGRVGTGLASGRAAIATTAKCYVRWQIADHVPSPGGGEGYVCMYVCAYGSRWDGMHVQHMSLLSCIPYLVLRGDVRSLLQKERTGRGMALMGCIMEGRIPILQ